MTGAELINNLEEYFGENDKVKKPGEMTSDEDSANEYWDPRGKKIVKKFKEDAVKINKQIKTK